MNMQAYSVLATVQKSDPAHELAAKDSRAERASGHETDRYYRTNHPEHLQAHTIPAILLTAAAGHLRVAAALRRAG